MNDSRAYREIFRLGSVDRKMAHEALLRTEKYLGRQESMAYADACFMGFLVSEHPMPKK